MAYIGSPVQQVLSRPTSQSFNGDGSTTVFTLNRSVNVSEELEVFVSNVQQEPGVGKSYTANGTSLTFDEAPPSGTGNIYVIYRGLSEVTRVLEHHHNNPLAATTGTFSGNVGIGTTSPGSKLAVDSPISTTYANGNTNITNSLFNITNTYTTSTANAQANMQLGIYDGTYNRVTGIAAVAESATNRKASLAFWTDDSGSRTEKLRITGDGNVGIGTNDPGAKLEVDRGSASFAAIFGAPQGGGRAVLFKDNHASPNRYNYLIGSQYNINNGFEITPSTAVGGTTFSNPAIAILETGKIGIGTNSPVRQLEITDGNSGKIRVSGPDGGMIECWNGSHGVYFGSGLLITGAGNTQDSVIFVEGGGSQRYYTSGYERMRITSAGKLCLGTTAAVSSAMLNIVPADTNRIINTRSFNTSAQYHHVFQNNSGTLVGGIIVSTTATAYNTSSDYRLKTAVNYDWDATTRLKQLKPARFEWIVDGDAAVPVDGFLAHEVQTVVPEAINGTHDEVDDDGNPVYQGIDQSKLVPLLVKTIQELEARITALENN